MAHQADLYMLSVEIDLNGPLKGSVTMNQSAIRVIRNARDIRCYLSCQSSAR